MTAIEKQVKDTLRRYFVGNRAAILSARWTGLWSRFIPKRAGNAGGFYWGPFLITWRKPYHKVWSWNETSKRWEHDHA